MRQQHEKCAAARPSTAVDPTRFDVAVSLRSFFFSFLNGPVRAFSLHLLLLLITPDPARSSRSRCIGGCARSVPVKGHFATAMTVGWAMARARFPHTEAGEGGGEGAGRRGRRRLRRRWKVSSARTSRRTLGAGRRPTRFSASTLAS